jgi:hypothetical protein
MHTMRTAAWPLVSLLAIVAVAAGVAATGAGPAAASGNGGGCDPYVDGTVIPVPCSSGSGSGSSSGSDGGGGSSVSNACTTIVLGKAQSLSLGLAWPPPQGQSWALLRCQGATGGAPLAVVVNNATGAPAVTPQQLLVSALGELRIPYIRPGTAPPRGRDGLVGLPEWFWIPAPSWHTRTLRVSAGSAWATVTAAPVGLTFEPGAGLSPVSCAGPGTAYNPHHPAATQHTKCSYTYLRPSAGQPGNSYQASVAVTWRVSWTGSDGAGGVLDADLTVPVDFAIPVGQAEALVTAP